VISKDFKEASMAEKGKVKFASAIYEDADQQAGSFFR
jgi:hypothetical protein